MPVPDYQSLMTPVLRELEDGRARAIAELRDHVADRIGLTVEDREELVPSGQKPLYHDRTSWAVAYLKQAKLLERPKRGVYAITERGREVLAKHPQRVDNEVLTTFPEFRDFLDRGNSRQASATDDADAQAEQRTPEESLQSAFRRVRAAIESELLDQEG